MAVNTHSLDLEQGSLQYASIVDGSQTGLDLSTDFTFEVGMKLESLASSAGNSFAIFDKDAGGSRGYLWQVNNTADKLRVLFLDGSANLSRFELDAATTAGSWAHYAVSVDISAPSAIWYVNGVVSAGTSLDTAATTINNSTAAFGIGADVAGTAEYFDGLLNNARIWSDIRTSSEIANNYQKVLTSGSNLVSAWYANNNHNDLTATGNNLTASGAPVFSKDIPFASESRFFFMSS